MILRTLTLLAPAFAYAIVATAPPDPDWRAVTIPTIGALAVSAVGMKRSRYGLTYCAIPLIVAVLVLWIGARWTTAALLHRDLPATWLAALIAIPYGWYVWTIYRTQRATRPDTTRDDLEPTTEPEPEDEPVLTDKERHLARATAVIPVVNERFTATADTVNATPVGRDEHGNIATVPFMHTLGAGITRAGKASIVWTKLDAWRHLIKDGLMTCYGIDPKYGAELSKGANLWTDLICRNHGESASEFSQRVIDFFTGLHREMGERYTYMVANGLDSLPKPTPELPFRYVFIDELVTLVGLCTDTKVRAELENLIAELLVLGGAAGYEIDAAGQDMRVTMIGERVRNGFPCRIGLRLANAQQVTMLFDSGALSDGVWSHKLPYTGNPNRHAGHAYLINQETNENVKFRFAYVSRDRLAELNRDFACPTARDRVALPDTVDTDTVDTAPVVPDILTDMIKHVPEWVGDRAVLLSEAVEWLRPDVTTDEQKRRVSTLIEAELSRAGVVVQAKITRNANAADKAEGRPSRNGRGFKMGDVRDRVAAFEAGMESVGGEAA